MPGVLDGIRVLDFGRYIAGPYCACLLGDLGAEVIRIEKLAGSEDRHQLPLGQTGPETNAGGALYIPMNRNKLGMTLNPMKDKGREIVKKLVATADVVVANLPPATLKAMGLDYESLTAVKPDIILTTVSAYGEGPYSERVGFDGIGQVMSGAAYMSGRPGDPMKLAAPWVDFGTASLTAFGTLAALMERQKTGRGQIVEGALLHTAVAFSNATLLEQAVLGLDREAMGNRGWAAGPVDIVKCKDGFIIVQVIGQPLFERWAKLMGEEDKWLNDPRFKDDLARGDNGEILSARMAEWCAERTQAEALAEMEAARVPGGPLLSPQQALDDPHIQASGMLHPTETPGLDKAAPVVRTPVKLSTTPAEMKRRAPTLGEHTEEIMVSLGYAADEIAALRAERVI
ncbi:MAG: CoA transferase [Maricaulaceae bacterium]|jgi:crotonobetainyl-CoA:carnitine CoA-transferase CaiB-like acyl-CoA transferase